MDHAKHTVDVHALSEEQYVDACRKGAGSPEDFGDKERRGVARALALEIAKAATGDPKIGEKLMPGQSNLITNKAFELMRLPKN